MDKSEAKYIELKELLEDTGTKFNTMEKNFTIFINIPFLPRLSILPIDGTDP